MPYKILLFLLFLYSASFGQKNEKSKQETLRLNSKKMPFVHVGKTNLYACKFEVSNHEYLIFLNEIRKTKGEAAYQQNLPDTMIWRSPLGYMEKFVQYYLRHPAFGDYPVVGVNYEQAENYCNWLTNSTNESINDKQIKKTHFRLPTEEEWELAALGGLPKGTIFPWGTESIRSEKGKYKGVILANCNGGSGDFLGSSGYLNDGLNVTCQVSDYWPNNFGIYHMAGNVAEMVALPYPDAEKLICKGGSWNKGSHKMVISSRDTFEVAASWVGFRVFAEIEEYQTPTSQEKVDAKFIEKSLSYIPAGGFQISHYYSIFEPDSAESNKKDNALVVSNFYFSKYEVTNDMYIQFLKAIADSVKRNKYTPRDENWTSETDLLQYQHYTTQFPKHPVVNITKEAMIAFCSWLTEQYNKDPKRKFEYVKFSLPSAKQQLRAMTGDLNLQSYSWGGPYNRNAKGEYMMNFNPLFDYELYDEDKLTLDMAYRKTQYPLLKKSRSLDDFELTAPVNSYYPSKFGIHNTNGNVAEVVSNSDYVLGGSFASINGNCSNEIFYNWSLFDNWTEVLPEKITLPSPQVGFRFVMEGFYDNEEHKK
jgi:formylglycine-generating enzyme required for sulfatase activity